ncbi:MAG: response regulator [Nitrososphaeraceae archaeon]
MTLGAARGYLLWCEEYRLPCGRQEGLERIRKDKFDLILLDIAMPEFTGLDIIKSIKQDGPIESRNIVFSASSNRR